MFARNAVAYAGLQIKISCCLCCWVFSFDVLPASTSHRDRAAIMSFLCQLFERFLRVLAQHDGCAVTMGIPVLFTGTQL